MRIYPDTLFVTRALSDVSPVDYNSWIESDKGLRLAASLDKDTVLAEGYKEYDTGRTYLARMGDWRLNKDEEVALDGVGGVNILVKADVHRSGTFARSPSSCPHTVSSI